jgi:hypothetical protein
MRKSYELCFERSRKARSDKRLMCAYSLDEYRALEEKAEGRTVLPYKSLLLGIPVILGWSR